MGDGISLISTEHPRSVWYKRLWFWLRPSKLNIDSTETVEINYYGNYPNRGLRITDITPSKMGPGDKIEGMGN